jgi:hypothetical protein
MIYHLVPEVDFRTQLAGEQYRPDDLDAVGSVHCASRESAIAVADDYFSAVTGPLHLLETRFDSLAAFLAMSGDA